MTFCFFSAQYLPTVGGVERYTNSLSKQLIQNGHKVLVVTSALEGCPQKETDKDNIQIIRLPVKMLMDGRFPVLLPSKQKSDFEKWFGENKPDFCVIQTRFYINSLFAARLVKKYKVSAMVVEHGSAHLINGGAAEFFGNIYEHTAIKYIYSCCKNFYGVSLQCCRWLGHFGVKTDKVLYNSVDPAALECLAEKGQAELKKRLSDYENLISQKRIIVFSARFIPEKGVLQLLDAFEKIEKKYPDTVLVMAGDGPLLQTAKDKKSRNVIIIGKLPYEENLALIQMGDIFCLPTFSEGFATAVLEAAALKTAILTTPTGGSPQLIENQKSGYLFKDMSSENIEKAMDFALSNEKWVKNAAQLCYEKLISEFTWEKTAQKLQQIAEQTKPV